MKLPSFLSRFSFSSIRSYVVAHKILSGVIAIAVLGGGWVAYGALTTTKGEMRYVLGTVTQGTIVATVSESGQVSTTDSIDVKPQVSGTITWVGVKPGQTVRAGQAIASVDDTDAAQSLADAEKSLAADELTYQQSEAEAPINYQKDQTALSNAQEDLTNDYNSAYNDIVASYLNLPDIMTGADNAVYGYDFDTRRAQWNADVLLNLFNVNTENVSTVQNFKTVSVSDYVSAKASYDAAVTAYQDTPRTADTSTLDALLTQTIAMETSVTETLQKELNFYGAVSDLATTYNITLPSKFSTVQGATQTNLTSANQDLQTLLSDKKTLDSGKQTIANDQNTLKLDQVGNPSGGNPISLQVSKNNLEKEEQDVANQKTDLAKYTIVAPYAGTVSAVNAEPGDSAGSAAVATIITDKQIATLSLNEVDVAKVALGDKATLTFDAVDGLTLTGTVAEIDSVGTVSQGVVSYTVKIGFDTQDTRVKPGMTVNADIQTGVHQDVLVVPQSAVKTVNGTSVVQVFTSPFSDADIAAAGSAGILSATPPESVPVVTGLSDDTNIEITSGLTEGQQIVVKTITSATKTSTSASAPSLLGGARGGSAGGTVRTGGGNATFIQRGG